MSRVSPLLLASIAGGIAYLLLRGQPWPPAAIIALKGSGVGFLALYAATRARSVDGWLLTAVMALGALGDMLLEIDFKVGAAAFGVGHIVAIRLYRRNRRATLSPSQRLLAWLLPPFGLAMPFLLLGPTLAVVPLAIYGLLLTLMASTAWTSRFSRYSVGLGATMFVVSDALIVARMQLLRDALALGLAVWILYYVGQALICTGVMRTLAASQHDVPPAAATRQLAAG